MIRDQFYTYFEAEKLLEEFEQLLKQYGIEIEQDSELECLCLNIIDVVEKHLKPNLRNPQEDIRPYFREFLGLQDLISKIIKAKDHPNFVTLIPHLRKLNISNPLQNVNTSILNQENNKTLELYIATLCMNLGEGAVTVDDPDNSKGDNPDIISIINGKKWGFACKSIHSLSTQTLYENIETAVKQIENSPSEVGMPILGIKNVVNHDDLWPLLSNPENDGTKLFGAFLDINVPLSKLIHFVSELHKSLLSEIGEENYQKLFNGKKALPVCLFYCATATSIIYAGQLLPTRLNVFNMVPFSQHIESDCITILNELNHQLQLT